MEIMLLPRTVGTLLGSKGGKGCQSVTATMFRPIQQRSNVATFIELKILVCDVYMHAQVDFESTICWRSVECWCTECEPFVKDTQNSSRYEFGENGGTSDRHLSRLKKKRPSNSLGWKKSRMSMAINTGVSSSSQIQQSRCCSTKVGTQASTADNKTRPRRSFEWLFPWPAYTARNSQCESAP